MSFAQAEANRLSMERSGLIFMCPNGQRSTVLKCPWPGCKEDAVMGWSCCGSHFRDMHPIASTPRRIIVIAEPRRTPLHFWRHA